jgi:carbamoyltransferase
MTSKKMDDLFDGPPRTAETDITQREMDIAASIQAVTEEIMLRISRHAQELTAAKNLVLAGGVALNCVGNGRILREGPFDDVWIQPAAGDAGGALGAALFVWHQLLGNPRSVDGKHDLQRGSLLGPSFPTDSIAAYLDRVGAPYTRHDDEGELAEIVAGLIADEQVVGHFDGRAEFGPRALGCRSILGDARSEKMQSVMNLKIKFRESFRPFAPCVLRERVQDWFEMRDQQDSPYMLLVAPVREDKRRPATDEAARGLDQLKQVRSAIPAVTHVDYSARVQTVDSERHPRLHRIMRSFEKKTGCPVIINTSFNVRGEPIVGSPEDAYRCFLATGMDALVLGNCLLRKSEQVQLEPEDAAAYLSRFKLD